MAFRGRNKNGQRRAMFYRLNHPYRSNLKYRNMTYNQLRSRGVRIAAYKDTDKDGVVNKYDCRPLDPKKQGRLHDAKMRILKRLEERAERKRERQQQKFNDLADQLKQRRATLAARNKIQAQKLELKREIQRERQQFNELKQANRDAKKELFRTSTAGRFISGTASAAKKSRSAIEKTNSFLKKVGRNLNKINL